VEKQPEWLETIAGRLPCPQCGRFYKRPDLSVHAYEGPLVTLLGVCIKCSHRTYFSMALLAGSETQVIDPQPIAVKADDVLDAHDRLQASGLHLADLFGEVRL
jgi:hypothetical protein